jgi:hypothetical protein
VRTKDGKIAIIKMAMGEDYVRPLSVQRDFYKA